MFNSWSSHWIFCKLYFVVIISLDENYEKTRIPVEYPESLSDFLLPVCALHLLGHHAQELGKVHRSTACWCITLFYLYWSNFETRIIYVDYGFPVGTFNNVLVVLLLRTMIDIVKVGVGSMIAYEEKNRINFTRNLCRSKCVMMTQLSRFYINVPDLNVFPEIWLKLRNESIIAMYFWSAKWPRISL